MQKLTLLVAVLALTLAGWQLFEADGLRTEVDRQRQELGTLAAELRVARATTPDDDQPPPLRAEPEAASTDAVPVLESVATTPEAIAKTVRDLKTELQRQKERVQELEGRVETQGQNRVAVPSPRGFIHDVNSAATVLDLDGGQKAELQRIVEDMQRQLADIRAIPNDEGKTWKDVQSNVLRSEGDGGAIQIAMPNFAEIQKWRRSRIPGSSETYGEAEARIKKDAKERFRHGLRPDQRKTFEQTHNDALFGGGHEGAGAFVFTSVATDVSTSGTKEGR